MTSLAGVAPEDRFCDLVMKGGITSGVVYPPAIWELAQKYRFKNIGGTSAGAIAAVVAAAAEYQRRISPGSTVGFELLASLPDALSDKEGTRKTKLLRLFQPDRLGRRLFRILAVSLNAKGTLDRVLKIALGCILSYWFASLASIGASLLIGTFHSLFAGLLFLCLSLPLFVGIFIYFDFTRGIVGNNYGLCKGMTTRKKDGPALTDWLHKLIQDAAGLRPSEPLTFGHLWGAPGFPPAWLELSKDERASVRSIDLQMFTTNLTHGRPYILPPVETTARLFFKPEELREYLPEEVADWFVKHAREYTDERRSPGSDPPTSAAVYKDKLGNEKKLLEIPEAKYFPVLLAARMSLSFPFLFAAVPLWAIDYEHPRAERKFRRCWFSDGGISSNFPVHLFDGLLPVWPTFAIQLEPALPGFKPDPKTQKNMIFLPYTYGQGIADRWDRFDEKISKASRMGGFLESIIGTMQNWNDNVLSRMPGVRDRVVRVRFLREEGGMNLNMEKRVIDDIALRGKEAARRLIKRFAENALMDVESVATEHSSPADFVIGKEAAAKTWQGWDFQRFVRLDVMVRTFADRALGLRRALAAQARHNTPYADLIKRAGVDAAPGHVQKLNPKQEQALTALSGELEAVSTTFEATAPGYPTQPIPIPELRVRPSL
jgi:predicted acylesterase/phospholipase RssA